MIIHETESVYNSLSAKNRGVEIMGYPEEGKRKKRGGRQKHNPPLKKRLLSITEEQAKLLRMWGRGDMSAGLRWLISQAAEVVYKPREDEAPVSDDHHSSR